jgi:hypothetical protein
MEELDLTIDHITLSVADLGRAKVFYSAALGGLGPPSFWTPTETTSKRSASSLSENER